MLKLIDTVTDNQARVELDGYIPFSLRLGVPSAQGSFIWHCSEKGTNGRVSTLEIWVHPRTGAIHDVTLVSILPSRIHITDDFDKGPTIPTSGRVPVCETEPWMRERKWNNPEEPAKTDIDEERRFDFFLGENFASVRFPDAGEPSSWIVNQRSRFGINEKGLLCRIELFGLKEEDVSMIREAVASSDSQQG